MADPDRIMEKLGELSGLMQATREDVKKVSDYQDEQGSSIHTLTTSIQVMQSCMQNIDLQTKYELKQVNDKLGRDYERINLLEKDKVVATGIDTYNIKKRSGWQWTLAIIGAILGILISVNQLTSIAQKFNKSDISTTGSVYATPLNDSTIVKVDSTIIVGNK